MKPPTVDFAIPAAGLSALARLVELGPTWIAAFQSAVETLGPNLYDPDDRAILLATEMISATPADVAQVLKGVMLPLAHVRAESGVELAEMLRALRGAIKGSRAPLKVEASDPRWEEMLVALGRLLDSDVVMIEAKTRRLLTAGVQTVQSARLICDARPVFDGDATRVQAVAVTSTLVLRYTDPDGDDHTLSALISEDQLADLEDQIGRARRKAGQLEAVFAAQGVPRLRIAPPDAAVPTAPAEGSAS